MEVKRTETTLVLKNKSRLSQKKVLGIEALSRHISRNDSFLTKLELEPIFFRLEHEDNFLAALNASKIFLAIYLLNALTFDYLPNHSDLKRLSQVMSKNVTLKKLRFKCVPERDYLYSNDEIYNFLASCQHAYIDWSTPQRAFSSRFKFTFPLYGHTYDLYLNLLKKHGKEKLVWNNNFKCSTADLFKSAQSFVRSLQKQEVSEWQIKVFEIKVKDHYSNALKEFRSFVDTFVLNKSIR